MIDTQRWASFTVAHLSTSAPLRSKTAAFTDARIRTMNEVITGMRIIKMYAWEKSFADLIAKLRK